MEGPEEEEEDQGQCNRHNNHEPRIGPFHIFERTAPDNAVPFRQAELGSELRPPFIYDTTDIPAHDVEADVDAASDLLATDTSWAFAHLNFSQITHGNECTRGGFHADFSDGCHTIPVRFRKSQRELKPPLAFIDLRRHSPADRGRDDLLHVSDVDAETGDLLPINVDDHIGLPGDLFDLDILHAIDLLHQGRNLLRLVPEHIEVVSEQLDGALGSDAGDQLIHSLLNRLAHEDGDAGDFGQLFPNRVRQS